MVSDGWQHKKLGEFVTLRRGHDLPEPQRKPGKIPVLGSFGITGYHDTATTKSPGVTIGRSGASFGVVCYSPIDFWALNTALYVIDFHGNDEKFTYYFLTSIDFQRYNSGGAQPSLNRNFIYPIPVNVPPPSEQKAIALCLSDTDALIAACDRAITKKRNIKQGAMQQLLTGKKRLPGFSGEWEVKTFGDISFVNQGLQIAIEKRLKNPLPTSKKYITIQFLNNGKDIEYINDYSSSVCCNQEDVLMTRTGNTGIVVSGVSGVFHNNFFKINFDRKVLDNNYLIGYLKLDKTQKLILTKAGTSTIPDLNHNDFYSLPIPLPPILEQKAIAQILSDMDAEIAALEKKRDKYKAIKQGMMQELLTGKTRLVDR